MLKKVVITNYLGESMEYAIEGAQPDSSSGLLITSIDGLGPTKATINMTGLTTTDGDIFNSARLSGRNIVIKGYFVHAGSIEEARLLSYKYFPIKKKVTVRVYTDNRTGEIEGYVESNEPDIFSEQSGCQISILCESPFFKDVGKDGTAVTRFSNVEPLFEFIDNSATAETDSYYFPDFEFGNMIHQRECEIVYNGDQDAGFNMNIKVKRPTTHITIYNDLTGETFGLTSSKLGGSGTFEIGDLITICTIQGQKSVYLTREGARRNILNAVDKNSSWFKLIRGNNLFSYETEPVSSEMHLDFSVVAQNIFEGV